MTANNVNNGSTILNDPETKKFLLEIIGDEGIEVVRALMDREATDEEIADETGIKLNVVRRVLYKLYDYRLASYVRTKDKEIGWYIYTWKLDLSKIKDIILERKRKVLEELMRKLDYETEHVFFKCKHDNIRLPFDIASENQFRCPSCNQPLEFLDNTPTIQKLQKEIERLKRELEHGSVERLGQHPQESGMS
ncbi:MAG: transcription factor E [Candidatus Hydrothermarchaeota archaeon]|nr:MAG: transcription factor E [Candidatus Hydrothermarchaeota archaeon]